MAAFVREGVSRRPKRRDRTSRCFFVMLNVAKCAYDFLVLRVNDTVARVRRRQRPQVRIDRGHGLVPPGLPDGVADRGPDSPDNSRADRCPTLRVVAGEGEGDALEAQRIDLLVGEPGDAGRAICRRPDGNQEGNWMRIATEIFRDFLPSLLGKTDPVNPVRVVEPGLSVRSAGRTAFPRHKTAMPRGGRAVVGRLDGLTDDLATLGRDRFFMVSITVASLIEGKRW